MIVSGIEKKDSRLVKNMTFVNINVKTLCTILMLYHSRGWKPLLCRIAGFIDLETQHSDNFALHWTLENEVDKVYHLCCYSS